MPTQWKKIKLLRFDDVYAATISLDRDVVINVSSEVLSVPFPSYWWQLDHHQGRSPSTFRSLKRTVSLHQQHTLANNKDNPMCWVVSRVVTLINKTNLREKLHAFLTYLCCSCLLCAGVLTIIMATLMFWCECVRCQAVTTPKSCTSLPRLHGSTWGRWWPYACWTSVTRNSNSTQPTPLAERIVRERVWNAWFSLSGEH